MASGVRSGEGIDRRGGSLAPSENFRRCEVTGMKESCGTGTFNHIFPLFVFAAALALSPAPIWLRRRPSPEADVKTKID